ncbi:MAG: hypothetical protein H6624_16295 [Bdellovibrionaceae bacterium]|nr:hypothetical protein [Bdellovibrionales bacterium]MCB9085909.1 hypothetical protein [Pseudobdellovibrionaceae bacterium]
MKTVVAAMALVLSASAMAFSHSVTDTNREYVMKQVTAQGVQGVNLTLEVEVLVDDCNQRSMDADFTFVGGNGNGWYDKYFADGYVMTTEMFCPIPNPYKAVVSSKPFFVKAFSNRNLDREVNITVVIPKGYVLKSTVVK